MEIINAFADYEPYAYDLPVITIKSSIYRDVLKLLKEQEVELCDRCGRMRLKSKRIVEGR